VPSRRKTSDQIRMDLVVRAALMCDYHRERMAHWAAEIDRLCKDSLEGDRGAELVGRVRAALDIDPEMLAASDKAQAAAHKDIPRPRGRPRKKKA
jgi:hypothetical protein